ncbi:MAG: outer membrane protein assembly factor BamD [Prevotella sp.]|nr:outer membrane protein assembly factor BamD [Bacteroides sp.]MCM1366634.1 outer membrane protein assembly factor BamD [Prevotella sp.]MCM1436999.1 outer membrane protein assembly factor BamD [Prevotella sp.]
MRRLHFFIPACLACAALFSSCGEYNKVLKSKDLDYKFEFAQRAYNAKKYTQAYTVLSDIITPLRGKPKGEEALYLLARSYYENKDYLNSGLYFKTYYQRYPKGKFTEDARFYSGYGYYLDSPDAQLDQSMTIKGIEELKSFLEYFPRSEHASQAQNAIFELQDKLTLKDLQNAQLYYNLGNFMGNNYRSAIIVSQNALKNYPYSKYREDFELLILKSKFQEARQSVTDRQADRYREVVDEYYSFINNFPDTPNRKEADDIFKIASKHAGTAY